jgi:hypothetical protein
VVYVALATRNYIHFIGNAEPNLGHPDGVLTTGDSLIIADLSPTASLTGIGTGVLYRITAAPHTLTVTKSGTGAGTIVSAPDGIDCGNDCSERYPAGYSVVLSAAAQSGSVFSGWNSGCASGTVTMDADRTCTAIFTGFPDLVTTSVSAPRSAKVGTSMSLSDTVANQGPEPAGSSVARYYLSRDRLRDNGDILLTGERAIPELAPGASSSNSDRGAVPESSEANNCAATGRTVKVQASGGNRPR